VGAVTAETYGIGDPKSETGIFIQKALEQVREVACLDLEPVLPPAPPPLPRRRVANFEPLPLTPMAAIAEITGKPLESGVRPVVRKNAQLETVHVRRRTFARWPLFLCAFVAAGFAGAAFVSSPLGHKPAVERVTSSIRSETLKLVEIARAKL
jgi:hypothetical protein